MTDDRTGSSADPHGADPHGADTARTALRAADLDVSESGISTLISALMHLADDPDSGSTDGWAVARSAQLSYEATRPSQDELNLTQAKALARTAAPGATVMHLETSDQDTYGFSLSRLEDSFGEDVEPEDLATLEDGLWPLLCDLSWNGVVGEDRSGYAAVSLLVDGPRFYIVDGAVGLVSTAQTREKADQLAQVASASTTGTVLVHDRHTETTSS